jgi:hypothetical protein
MFTAHIVVLYYQETLIIIGFATELDIPPLERYEFSPPQPGTHCHQQQGMIVRANLPSSFQKLLNFQAREGTTLGIRSLCRTCETAQPGSRIRLAIKWAAFSAASVATSAPDFAGILSDSRSTKLSATMHPFGRYWKLKCCPTAPVWTEKTARTEKGELYA